MNYLFKNPISKQDHRLKVSTSTCKFWGVTIQPVTNGIPQNFKASNIGSNLLSNQRENVRDCVYWGVGVILQVRAVGSVRIGSLLQDFYFFTLIQSFIASLYFYLASMWFYSLRYPFCSKIMDVVQYLLCFSQKFLKKERKKKERRGENVRYNV